MCLQEGEDRTNSAILFSWEKPEACEDISNVFAYRGGTDEKAARDVSVRRSFGHQREHFPFTFGERIDEPGLLSLEQVACDFGIDDRATISDGANRLGEIANAVNALLQEVADGPFGQAEKVSGVAVGDILR